MSCSAASVRPVSSGSRPMRHSPSESRARNAACSASSYHAKNEGKTIVGLRRAAKGNTLLNYCGVRTDFVDYVVDRNPRKQGPYLPGTHIPIHDPDRIAETRPDYLLILPWNLQDEVMRPDEPRPRVRLPVRRPDPPDDGRRVGPVVPTAGIAWETVPSSERVGAEMHALMAELYPICRSLTGDGVRDDVLDPRAGDPPAADRGALRARRCSTGSSPASGTSGTRGSRRPTAAASSTSTSRTCTCSGTAAR